MLSIQRLALLSIAVVALVASGCQAPSTAPSPTPGTPSAAGGKGGTPHPVSSVSTAPAVASPSSAAPASPSPGVQPEPSAQAASPHAGSSASPRVVARGHGVIRAIDADGLGVTIEHEANESLGVDAGVSHYRVGDRAVVADLKAGDEVDYDVDVGPNGGLVVSGIVEMGR
ncbi:MAG: hypothetical protein EB084_07600 [Proteobacteria bacterium]|nr:hypothetical protein [Pseudomonadota bacterium]